MRALALLALGLLALPFLPLAGAGGGSVLLVDVEGVVTQGTTIHIERALAEAEDRGIPLVLRLNTPGGLVDATLDIDTALANAQVPVLTYVGPRSAFAASAGTFLLLMGQPSGMSEGTTIGSAQPITVGADGQSDPAGEKVENFLVGRIKAIAERTGRDPDVAALYITENVNHDQHEALAAGMIDVVAPTLREFLDAVDGETARVAGGTTILRTEGARIEAFKAPILAQFVNIISNPQIAFILILAGTYGVIFGLANGGTYVPEVIGAVLLLLGFVGLGMFGASTAGVIFLLLAMIFFVAEVFTPTNGFLTVVGVVSLILSVLFLIREPLLPPSFLQTFTFVGYAIAIAAGALVFAAVWLAARTSQRKPFDALDGAEGLVIDALTPAGRIEVHGEVWKARIEGEAPVGAAVRVTGRNGLTLLVEAIEEA